MKNQDKLQQIQNSGAILFGAAGEMGSKITSTFVRASIPTLMQDIDLEKLELSRKSTLESLEKALKKRKLSKEQFELITKNNLIRDLVVFPEKGKIPFEEIKDKNAASSFLDKTINQDLKNKYQNSFMVLEAGPEILSFKQNVFEFFEHVLLSKDAILATNTSSLKVSDIAAKLKHPERAIGYHYFLPAHVNPLMEIIVGDKTSPETVKAMCGLATAMGKKPIVCLKDTAGAIANRILVGVLNEAAKLYDEGLGSVRLIDKVFLEVFYSKQINIQTSKAKRQFQAAPKLSFFKDEESLYTQITECEAKHDFTKKKILLEELEGRLRQKVLYTQIVENLAVLGELFKPAPCVKKLKLKIQEQIKKIREHINNIETIFRIKPYDFPLPENLARKKDRHDEIKERLQRAYITIAQDIYNEGLGSIQDIELACKEGFKWNVGPFELINSDATNKNELSGVKTQIQDNVGFIILGKLHIQQLQMTQNSLSPEMLNGISLAIKEFESNEKIKTIIIKSQGGGPFSAGADLDYIESTNWNIDEITRFINLGKYVMDEIANCSKPTVVIIDGPAVGGGAELALACDYRIMTDLSYISFPEVALGIIPDWGGTERLPKLIGKELAKRLICTATLKNLGLKLSAEDAFKTGFADAYILQSNLPHYLNTLINKTSSTQIDIFSKPKREARYEKSDYPENIVKRFKLNKPFKPDYNLFTRFGAKLALKLIENSDNDEYVKKVNNNDAARQLLTHGKRVFRWQIKPFIKAAQNKYWATLFEKVGIM